MKFHLSGARLKVELFKEDSEHIVFEGGLKTKDFEGKVNSQNE